jgi:hypothetical protein
MAATAFPHTWASLSETRSRVSESHVSVCEQHAKHHRHLDQRRVPEAEMSALRTVRM